MKRPTINQINSFCIHNPILQHYLAWRESENTLLPAWKEYIQCEPWRDIQRKTVRGNCIYGNLLKSIGAFIGVRDLNGYDYHRDHLNFDLDVRFTVSLDVDGVWIKAQLPWEIENEYGFKQAAFLKERLRADVEFDAVALLPVVRRYHERLFFPKGTLLGKIQRQYRKDKKDAIKLMAEHLKEKKQSEVSNDDLHVDPSVQRAIARRLKRVYNIDAGIYWVGKELFSRLAAQGRQATLKRLSKLDVADLVTDFDGDMDELETEFYSRFEEDAIYI